MVRSTGYADANWKFTGSSFLRGGWLRRRGICDSLLERGPGEYRSASRTQSRGSAQWDGAEPT